MPAASGSAGGASVTFPMRWHLEAAHTSRVQDDAVKLLVGILERRDAPASGPDAVPAAGIAGQPGRRF